MGNTNLYKVRYFDWVEDFDYVAAENQLAAIKKSCKQYEGLKEEKFSVEYLGEIIV